MSGLAFVSVGRTLIRVDLIESISARYGPRKDNVHPAPYVEVRTVSGAVYQDGYLSLAELKDRIKQALAEAAVGGVS